MTAIDMSTVFVPVPLRWRHVRAGDTFLGQRQEHWHVTRIGPTAQGFAVVAAHADDVFGSPVDPDDRIDVLVPVLEADVVELTIEQLGARLVERREATEAELDLPEPPEME